MSEIRFKRAHPLTVAQAKTVAQKAADDLADEYDLNSEWEGDTLNFQRAGLSGQMRVTASEIDLSVKLGLLFTPFKAKFESHIAHRLDELLLAAAPGNGKSAAKPKAGAKTAMAKSARKPKA